MRAASGIRRGGVHRGQGALDHTAAEALLALIEHHRLARRNRALRQSKRAAKCAGDSVSAQLGPVGGNVSWPRNVAAASVGAPATQCKSPASRPWLNNAG